MARKLKRRWAMNPLRPTTRHLTLALLFLVVPTPACLTTTVDASEEGSEGPSPSVCEVGSTRICQQNIDPNQQGIASCVATPNGNAWSECAVNPDMGKANCDPSQEEWNGYCCVDSALKACCAGEECMTPLVLSLDGRAIETTSDQGATFDLSGHDMSHVFDWPTAATPWLALDIDSNGTIDGGHELFGSAVRLESGAFARNGFEALGEYDTNRDGRIDVTDPVFARLLAWGDTNLDRVSQPGELRSIASLGVEQIALDYRIVPQCDERGNCGLEQASLGFGDDTRSGRVIDLHLKVR